MRLPVAVVLGLGLALAGPAVPASELPLTEFLRERPALLLSDVPAFLEFQRALRDDVESGRIGPLRGLRKRELYAAQDQLEFLLAEVRAVDELSESHRVRVYNAQSTVAAIVAEVPGRQEVCVREKPLGSHRLVVSCYTQDERRAAKLRSQTLLIRLHQTAKANARAGS